MSQPRDQKHEIWDRGILGGNPELAIDFCMERGGSYVSACELFCEYRHVLKMLTAIMHLFEELCIAPCDKEVKQVIAAVS